MPLPRYQDKAIKPISTATIKAQGQQAEVNAFANIASTAINIGYNVADEKITKYAKESADDAFLKANSTESGKPTYELMQEDTKLANVYNSRLVNLAGNQAVSAFSETARNIALNNEANPKQFDEQLEKAFSSLSNGLPKEVQVRLQNQYQAEHGRYSPTIKKESFDRKNVELVNASNKTLKSLTDNISYSAYNGNKATLEADLKIQTTYLKTMVQDGYITEQQMSAILLNTQKNAVEQRYYGENDKLLTSGNLKGSQDYINTFSKSKGTDYSVQERQAITARMQSKLNGYIQQEKDNKKFIEDTLKVQMRDAIKVFKNGGQPENGKALIEASKGTKYEKSLSEAVTVGANVSNFKVLTPQEQEINLERLRNKPIKTAYEIDLLKTQEGIYNRTKTLAKKNPYALFMKTSKNVKTEPTYVSYSDGFKESLQTRIPNIKRASSKYNNPAGALTQAEVISIGGSFPAMGRPEKLAVISAIASLPEDVALNTFSQIDVPSSYLMAGVMQSKGDSGSANLIIQGETILSDTKFNFSGEGYVAIKTTIGNTFAGNMSQNVRKTYENSIKAMYVALAENEGIADPTVIDEDIMEQAIETVTNGVLENNGRSFFSYKKGKDKDDFFDAMDLMTFEPIYQGQGLLGVENSTEMHTLFEKVQDDGSFINIGDGKYYMKIGNKFIQNKQGKNFVLDMTGAD